MEDTTIFHMLYGMGDEAQKLSEYTFQQTHQLLQEADTLLSNRFNNRGNVKTAKPDNICQLLSLGYSCSDQDNSAEIAKVLFDSLKHFISQQTNFEEPFSITLTRHGENIKCLIGTKYPALPLLRASYGEVKTIENICPAAPYPNHTIAHIVRFSDTEDNIDTTAEYEQYCSWIDRIASAHFEKDYCVTVSCTPLSDDLLQKRYDNAAIMHNKLSRCKTFEWSVGYNSGSNSSKSAILVSGGDNNGRSSQISGDSEDYRVSQMLTRLECEMKRLLAAKDLGGYQVQVQLSAVSKEDLAALNVIVSGALAEERLKMDLDSDTDGWLLGSELCYVLQLPSIAFPGFELCQNITDAISCPMENVGVTLGKALYNGIPNCSFSIPAEQFNRHAFVCGMTGSGKTNTVFSFLTRIGLPFLVIEPVKGEYSKLKQNMPGLMVYTMNAADTNSLALNPFWFPKGSNIQYHMDALKALIISSFSLTAAMPNIIEQCISNVYFNRGWNTATGRNLYEDKLPEQYLYPTFSDLKQEVDAYLKRSKYAGETLATYQGALLTRLSSYTEGIKGMLLNVPSHPDFSEWEHENIVIELDMLSEDADKAIVMGSILLQYFQYLKLKNFKNSDDTFSHLIVIEEAHRLFKNVDVKHRDLETANPQAQLVETLSNLMAEIRAYGEGIIVVDQSPVKIAPDVIRNSNIKIVHRLDMRDDIELVQNALLLKNNEKMFSQLKRGQALVRFEEMASPALIQIDPYKGGTHASPKESGNHQVLAIENHSPVADFLLGNVTMRTEIDYLADRLVKSVLYDNLNNINDWFCYCVQMLLHILSAFGYSQRECNFTSEVFNHLLFAGVEDSIVKNPVFGNQFVFGNQLKMFFNRALHFFKEDRIKPKECVLFFHFRQVQLWPALKDFLRYRSSHYTEITQACSQCVPYMELLNLLAELYEHRHPLTMDSLKADSLETFVSGELQKCMIPPVSSLFISEVSQNLNLLLKKRL